MRAPRAPSACPGAVVVRVRHSGWHLVRRWHGDPFAPTGKHPLLNLALSWPRGWVVPVHADQPHQTTPRSRAALFTHRVPDKCDRVRERLTGLPLDAAYAVLTGTSYPVAACVNCSDQADVLGAVRTPWPRPASRPLPTPTAAAPGRGREALGVRRPRRPRPRRRLGRRRRPLRRRLLRQRTRRDRRARPATVPPVRASRKKSHSRSIRHCHGSEPMTNLGQQGLPRKAQP